MPVSTIRPVQCKGCGHKQSIWDVRLINVQKSPKLKNKLLQGTLFPMRCKQCGEILEQAQHCIYMDPKQALFIELCAPGESIKLPEIQENWAKHGGGTFRLVRTAEELQEKIRIFDCELDDRVVEVIRVLMTAQLEDQSPGLMDGRPVFTVDKAGPQLICACTDESERVCPISQTLYEKVQRQYLKSKAAQEETMIVDSAWVYRILVQSGKV